RDPISLWPRRSPHHAPIPPADGRSPPGGWSIRVMVSTVVDMCEGVESGEFDADLVGVGGVELVEDGQGLLPSVLGGLGVAGVLMGVAEAGESGRFFVTVAEVPEQVKGVLVAGDGLDVVAEVVVGVAEAVPRVRLPVAVVELLEQVE